VTVVCCCYYSAKVASGCNNAPSCPEVKEAIYIT
jgi:hypothetical protein